MTRTDYERLDERVFRSTLPNGLQIMVVPREGFTRHTAYLAVNYGAIHTDYTLDGVHFHTPDGVAHYLEHKTFDLPGNRDVTAEFAALGANPNAFTTYDLTAYYFTGTSHFEESLRLLIEMVTTPYFTDETVEKERGIIAQEILMYEDSADSRVFEDLTANLYANHPIRIPVAGTVESIQAITPEILHRCHRAFYVPANMTLCVVGDVDPETVEAIAAEKMPRERLSVGIPHLGAGEALTFVREKSLRHMDVSMPTFQLGFKCRPGFTGEAFAHWELVAELAAEVLFGESSRLYLELYGDNLIDSSFGGGAETVEGTAMITCGGDSDDPEAVRDAILRRAGEICREGITPEEFDRMKKSLLGRKVRDLDSFDATCFRLCAYGMEHYDYFRFPETFETVEPEELTAFLAENIRPERCSLAVVEPLPQEEEN